MNIRLKLNLVACALLTAAFSSSALLPGDAAENLKLAPGVSYTSDIGTVFPIAADKMDDVTVEPGRPALIFFGAPGDLNTNRQAKRVVQLYDKHRDNTKFIIVNVDNPSDAGRDLIRKYYPGYVPAQLLLDKSGTKVWSSVGEISRKKISGQINHM
jgi:hypothetical protein